MKQHDQFVAIKCIKNPIPDFADSFPQLIEPLAKRAGMGHRQCRPIHLKHQYSLPELQSLRLVQSLKPVPDRLRTLGCFIEENSVFRRRFFRFHFKSNTTKNSSSVARKKSWYTDLVSWGLLSCHLARITEKACLGSRAWIGNHRMLWGMDLVAHTSVSLHPLTIHRNC